MDAAMQTYYKYSHGAPTRSRIPQAATLQAMHKNLKQPSTSSATIQYNILYYVVLIRSYLDTETNIYTKLMTYGLFDRKGKKFST